MDGLVFGLYCHYYELQYFSHLVKENTWSIANGRLPNGLKPEKVHPFTSSNINTSDFWRRLNLEPTSILTQVARDNAEQNIGAKKIIDALHHNRVSLKAFFDVDHTLINVDAQHKADTAALSYVTLEMIGFIVNNFIQLKDRNITLSELLKFKRNQGNENLLKGREIFETVLNKLGIRNEYNIVLSDDDFVKASKEISDALYRLVIDPLMNYFDDTNVIRDSVDIQSGEDRMKKIFEILASISHLSTSEFGAVGIQFKHFHDFNFDDLQIDGASDFIKLLRSSQENPHEIVAITRGCQIPYVKENANGLGELFDKVYSSLVTCERNPYKQNDDLFHSKKTLRPYSTITDNLSTKDKLKIVVHEAIQCFVDAKLSFDNEEQFFGAIDYYLRNCIFFSDSDLEVWGTVPTVLVISERTPSLDFLKKIYGDYVNKALPFSIINPHGLENDIAGEIGLRPFRPHYDKTLAGHFTGNRDVSALALVAH